MSSMLFTDEGRFTTLGEAAAGHLVRWFGYREGVEPLLIVAAEDERRALALVESADWALFQGDNGDRVLDLGRPTVRYDPASRRKRGDSASPGDLVWVAGRFGIRGAGGRFSGRPAWDRPIGWLDGAWSSYDQREDDETFTRWQLGFMRKERFIVIVDRTIDRS